MDSHLMKISHVFETFTSTNSKSKRLVMVLGWYNWLDICLEFSWVDFGQLCKLLFDNLFIYFSFFDLNDKFFNFIFVSFGLSFVTKLIEFRFAMICLKQLDFLGDSAQCGTILGSLCELSILFEHSTSIN